jgi:hypothetical protein
MNITWVSTPSDCEFDLTRAVARDPSINLKYYCMIDPQDQNVSFHLSQFTYAPNIDFIVFAPGGRREVFEEISRETCDLLVMRPVNLVTIPEQVHEVVLLLQDQPLVVWTWEWLPNIVMNQMPPLEGYPRIAVTNKMDLERCKKQYLDSQALYFPFGVIDFKSEDLVVEEKYKCDLVCDAQPHYDCNEYHGVKHRSVNIMVQPFLTGGYNLSLWGNRYSEVTSCDWAHNDMFAPFVKGTYSTKEYPKVYASSKIYLGATWNATSGGYSIRLSRALGCNIMVIWQETLGKNFDIPIPVVEWSNSAERTVELVNTYLKDDKKRVELAACAKAWALHNWGWKNSLERLIKEIS